MHGEPGRWRGHGPQGGVQSSERDVSGDPRLTENPALVVNAWAFAENEALHRRSRSIEKREHYRKQAEHHSELACAIAQMASQPGSRIRVGWCSGCFDRTAHREVAGRELPPAYLCRSCGSPTSPCVAPRCDNMANRGVGRARVPRYCAEHRHDIPGFARRNQRIATLDLYEQVLVYDRANLAKATKLMLVGSLRPRSWSPLRHWSPHRPLAAQSAPARSVADSAVRLR